MLNTPEPSGEGDGAPDRDRAAPDSLVSLLPRAALVREAPPEPPRSYDLTRLVTIALVVLAVLMVGLSTAVVGAAGIERAERAHQLAERDLYARIQTESALLRHDFRSERTAEIDRLFDGVVAGTDPATRRQGAARLVLLLGQESRARHDRPLGSEEALRRDLEAAVRALRRLESDLEARRREIGAARGSVPGRLATLLGA